MNDIIKRKNIYKMHEAAKEIAWLVADGILEHYGEGTLWYWADEDLRPSVDYLINNKFSFDSIDDIATIIEDIVEEIECWPESYVNKDIKGKNRKLLSQVENIIDYLLLLEDLLKMLHQLVDLSKKGTN